MLLLCARKYADFAIVLIWKDVCVVIVCSKHADFAIALIMKKVCVVIACSKVC